MTEQVLTPPLASLSLSPRPRTPLRLPESQFSGPRAGTEAGRPVRLCRACGAHGAWHGSSYCCVRCRDTGGTEHGLWCSQDCPGPGVANCTMASRSSFTLAAQVGPDLAAFRSAGRILTRVTIIQYIQRREWLTEEARLEGLLEERFGWINPDRCPSRHFR